MCQTIFGNDLYPENILKSNQKFSLMIHMPYLFKIIMCNCFSVTMIDVIMLTLAYLGGGGHDAKFSHFHAVFLEIFAKSYVGASRGLAPPSLLESWNRP